MNCKINAWFIEFENAFDRIQHYRFFQILKNSAIDNKDLRLIRILYLQQFATVRIYNLKTQNFDVKRGVRLYSMPKRKCCSGKHYEMEKVIKSFVD